MVSASGIVTCLDARTGKRHWQERLKGEFSASPTYAAGRIYLTSEAGVTTVLEPGTRFHVLATNRLEGGVVRASPAACDGALYVRTERYLYRIEEQGTVSSDTER
jgi:outer membrane protein assembly factor BamB